MVKIKLCSLSINSLSKSSVALLELQWMMCRSEYFSVGFTEALWYLGLELIFFHTVKRYSEIPVRHSFWIVPCTHLCLVLSYIMGNPV